jgi:hypothetical protein
LTILILQPFFLIDVLVSDANGKVAFCKSEKYDQKKSAAKYAPGTGILNQRINIKRVDFNYDIITFAAIPKALITTI